MKLRTAQLSRIKTLLGVVYVLFLITPLVFSSTNALASALGEIRITSPSDGETITSPQFTVAVDYYLEIDPKESEEYAVDLHVINTTTRETVYEGGTFVAVAGFGKLSFSVDLSGQPPGEYEVEAHFGSLVIDDDPNDNFIPNWMYMDSHSIIIIYSPPVIAPSSIYFQSDPGDAEIWVNGKLWGTTPFGNTSFGFTDLQPGRYSVIIKKEGYIDYTETVILAENEIRDVFAKLETGTTSTGWINITSDPTGAIIYIGGTSIGTSPMMLPGVPSGNYNITLKKEGYEDWNDTITVIAGQTTDVYAYMPSVNGGVNPGPIIGGAAGVGVTSLIVRRIIKAKKPAAKIPKQPAAPKAYEPIGYDAGPKFKPVTDWRPKEIIEADKKYGEAKKAQEVIGKLTSTQFHDPTLNDFVNKATQSDVFFGTDGHVKIDKINKLETTVKTWIKRDQMIDQTPEYTTYNAYTDSANDIQTVAACTPLRIGAAIASGGLSEAIFIPVSASATTMQLIDAGASYEQAKAAGIKQAATEGAMTVGMTLGIKYGIKGIGAAVNWGAKQFGYEVRLFTPSPTGNLPPPSPHPGGRNIPKTSEPVPSKTGSTKLAPENPELASDLNKFKQIADDNPGNYNRTDLMHKTKTYTSGEPPAALDKVEQEAVDLWKKHGNDVFKNPNVPDKLKNALDTGKQKIYQNARNDAIVKTIEKMKADGIDVEGKVFKITQTGTHAQPGNPGFKPGSDYDATGHFPPKYNKLYEEELNNGLKKYGFETDPNVLKTGSAGPDFGANVYGEGTSSLGAYKGGALKQVEHYNQTSGSEVIIKSEGGKVKISTETPQYTESLNTKWKAGDYASAQQNYQNFAADKIMKNGGVDNILKDPAKLQTSIKDLSKEVSRMQGEYSASSAEQFRVENLSRAEGPYKFTRYEPPPAARVADYMKRYNMPIEQAKLKAGFTGSDQELFQSFVKLLGL